MNLRSWGKGCKAKASLASESQESSCYRLIEEVFLAAHFKNEYLFSCWVSVHQFSSNTFSCLELQGIIEMIVRLFWLPRFTECALVFVSVSVFAAAIITCFFFRISKFEATATLHQYMVQHKQVIIPVLKLLVC